MPSRQIVMRILKQSIQLLAAITVAAILYGTAMHGHFTLLYVFTANFLAGALIISAGLVIFIVPIRPKGKLIDHSTFGAALMEMREKKRKRSLDLIYLGICIILIPAVIQFIFSLIF